MSNIKIIFSQTSNDSYVKILKQKPKKISHNKLQKNFNKILKKLEKQEKERFLFTGNFLEEKFFDKNH